MMHGSSSVFASNLIRAGFEIPGRQVPLRAAQFEAWAYELASVWNILSADVAIFRLWAKLMHRQPDHLYEDALIAATAQIHNLTVVTRNTTDFTAFGVPLFNPFGSLPASLDPVAYSAPGQQLGRASCRERGGQYR